MMHDRLSQAYTKHSKFKETLVYFDSLLHCDNHKLLWNVVSQKLFIVSFYCLHNLDFDLICWLISVLSLYSMNLNHWSNLGSKDFSKYFRPEGQERGPLERIGRIDEALTG